MTTALTIGPTKVASTTLPTTANALTTNTGAFTGTASNTTIGQSTGFGQLWSQGTSQSWPHARDVDDPDAHGWVWDVSSLEGQQLLAGIWSGNLSWAVSAGSIVCDVYIRFSLFNTLSGTFKTIGALVAPQQTISTSFGFLPISGLLPAMTCGVGDRLYMDCWVNITSNSTGSPTATLQFGGISSTLLIDVAYTTPGYQPLTTSQLATRYAYGSFAFHDGSAYFLLEKSINTVSVQQTLFKIARFEGVKKTGEITNERRITLRIRVLGTSRADLEQKLDALALAFAARQQHLTLHATDGRYFVADCVDMKAPLPPGAILSTVVTAEFICQQPYAYAAAASNYATGNLLMATSGASAWSLPSANNPLTIWGGATVFARPLITITNQTTPNATTLSAALTSGVAATTLSVAALPAAATSGQTFLLVSGTHSQRVTLSANALAGATSLSVTSFTPNFSYPIGSFCGLDIYLTAFTLSQQPDGQVLTVSNIAVQAVGNGQSLAIDCDPTDSSSGYSVIPSSTNTPIAFSGSFPVLQPGATSLYLTVTCSNPPTLQVSVTWTPRWLA